MQKLFIDEYNDLSQSTGLYSIGSRLMICYGNTTTGNNTPIYVNITDGNTSINNLEMCEVEPMVFTIDLAPFIQSFFTKELKPFENTYNENSFLKKITVTVNSYGEEYYPTEVFSIWCMRNSFFKPEIVQGAEWTSRDSSMEANVYISDIKANDLSPIILPNENIRLYKTSYGFQNDDEKSIIEYTNFAFVSSNASTISVMKRFDDNGVMRNITIGYRPVIRRNFCNEKQLMVMYLTPYGNFEYFIFDGYTSTTTVEKQNQYHNTLIRNGNYLHNGSILGNSKTISYTASIVISDEVIASKWNDLISSTQVFLYNGEGSMYGIGNFTPVFINGDLQYNPKKGSRQSLVITNNMQYTW